MRRRRVQVAFAAVILVLAVIVGVQITAALRTRAQPSPTPTPTAIDWDAVRPGADASWPACTAVHGSARALRSPSAPPSSSSG